MTENTAIVCERETRNNINGVEYIVKSYFKKDARETAEEKLLRLVKECVANEVKSPEYQAKSTF